MNAFKKYDIENIPNEQEKIRGKGFPISQIRLQKTANGPSKDGCHGDK